MTTDDRPTNDRPAGQFTHFAKISNGHNSATRQPIPFMFGSRLRFLGTADRTAPFPVGSNSRLRPAAILENFKWPYISNQFTVCMYTDHTLSLSLIYRPNDGDSKLISQEYVLWNAVSVTLLQFPRYCSIVQTLSLKYPGRDLDLEVT